MLSTSQHSMANVTYIEGDVTQNTIWTLIDSPFVISHNVTVYSNSTLTIEPGVEVRFGKDLNLIVQGKLLANGQSMQINFTSNREQGAPGDWGSIIFSGSVGSDIRGCSITFAKDGILAQNSFLNVRSNTISYCSQNGVNSTNSNLDLEDNLILNSVAGVAVMGSGTVSIHNNTILANEDGIVLTGSLVSNLNIQDNSIFQNTHAGIAIDADNHTNISITHNIVSSNGNGFYISSPTPIVIANNSISGNSVGFLYNSGNHEAHYNDIYDNTIGIDASANATCDATDNYWGSPSGPYNDWLNPRGRGNPVAGDGSNLNFIFFLTHPVQYINSPPTAELFVDKSIVWTGEPDPTVTFIATNSHDEGRVDWYKFDFGDGQSTGWTTLSTFTHVYSPPGGFNETYPATVTVMDDFGALASDTKNVFVDWTLSRVLEVNTVVNSSSYTLKENENISMSAVVTYLGTAVENVSVTFYAVRGGTFSQSQGLTDANGYFTTIFSSPDVSELTNIKIIATASMTSPTRYADGSSGVYLSIEPSLSVSVQPDQPVIKSESSTPVTILVTTNDQPIANANVTLQSDVGDLSIHSGTTDVNGVLRAIFYAPTTTTGVNSVIMASAEFSDYGNGVGQTTIRVDPKVLTVTITADPNTMLSEAMVNVTVHVEYDSQPINEATVVLSSLEGNFTTNGGTTNANGNATFIWTSPPANEQTDVTIVAEAALPGYADGSNEALATVNPRTFNIQLEPSPSTIEASRTAVINVNVTCMEDGIIVPNATISISASQGSFLISNEILTTASKETDLEGLAAFVYTGPQTGNPLNVVVTVNVTKPGYESLETTTALTVVPSAAAAGGGWPFMMMLLILIPVVILIIVVVLIKMKVIVFSSQEEE